MMFPLLILGALTIGAGFLPFSEYVSADCVPRDMELHLTFSIAPVLTALAGIMLAMSLYRKQNEKPAKMAALFDIKPVREAGIHPSAVIDPTARIAAGELPTSASASGHCSTQCSKRGSSPISAWNCSARISGPRRNAW